VNPEALEEAKERFEERLDCVIVLRVLTKEEIQKLADRTSALRGRRFSSITPCDDVEDAGLRESEDHLPEEIPTTLPARHESANTAVVGSEE